MCNDSEKSSGSNVLAEGFDGAVTNVVVITRPTAMHPGSQQQAMGRQVRRQPYRGPRPQVREVAGWNCTSCNKFHPFSPGLDLAFTQRIMNFCQGCGQRNYLQAGKVIPNKGRKKCARPRAV